MQQVIEAMYENGVFWPLKTLEFSEGQAVQLIIHTKAKISPGEMLQLVAEVYVGLSDDEIDEVEKIALDRRKHPSNNVET